MASRHIAGVMGSPTRNVRDTHPHVSTQLISILALLNVFETLGNVLYLYKTHIAPDPIASFIGFTVATMSFSKTVLYWAQEYYCGYCAVGHNDPWTLFTLWVIPNGYVYSP